MASSPTRPQSPLTPNEAQFLLGHITEKKEANWASIMIRYLPILLLGILGILGLVFVFHSDSFLNETCRMHHDEFYGKLWLECPEAMRKAFGPRH